MTTRAEWIPDLGTMTCRNNSKKITVKFEKKGNALVGKIKDMPDDLFIKWAVEPNSEKKIANVVLEAEQVFLKSFISAALED